MTENKRFAVTQTTFGSGIYDYQAEDTLCESYDEDAYGEVCKKLNELADEKLRLEKENKELKFQLEECRTNKLFSRRELEKENKELKERNNRQAKRLDNLYNLIEKQDWKTLTGLIQEFQECEEQLEKEWKCYE